MPYTAAISNIAAWTGQDWIILAIALVAAAAIIAAVTVFYRMHSRNERERYEFITIIAHKFRTPLTQVKWSIETLLKSALDPYQREGITNILSSNENLIKLTGTLIELTDPNDSTSSAYHLERLNLCDLAREAVAEAKTAFHEKNIFIGISCAGPGIWIKGDHARLRFVTDTLLENACLYSPPGRDVTVAVESRGRTAVLSVIDHGMGIEPRDLGRIFSKFFRAKNAQSADTEGVGVGLYLARSVVNRHGGKIRVFSEGAGRGSTFSVSLPMMK